MSALKTRVFAVLLLAWPLASANPVLAAQPTTTEIHRKSVDALDTGGWQPAVSTKGHFSIRVPVTFNDFTIHGEDENIGEMVVHVIGGRSDDGVRFTVTETVRTPRMKNPDIGELAADFGKKPGTKVADIAQESKDGADRISFSVTGLASSAYMQMIKTETALYSLMLEFPNAKRSKAAQVKGAFFDSFKLKN
jgi:hypothetical protein